LKFEAYANPLAAGSSSKVIGYQPSAKVTPAVDSSCASAAPCERTVGYKAIRGDASTQSLQSS
jgi:hypothetical protein